jgi:hypothetical protein
MWNPHEIRKLVSQLAGIALGVGGFYLLVQGVQASGRINVSSNIVSGELESGSAGLFLLFLGFLLIVMPTLWGGASTNVESAAAGDAKARNYDVRLIILAVAAIVVTFLLLFGGEYLAKQGWEVANFLIVAGLLCGIASAFLVVVNVMMWLGIEAPPPKGATLVKRNERDKSA